jgi:hypothetical protein
VKDTGIRISDRHQKLLFERFKQVTPRTDRVYRGYGLGLNISRRLCHIHRGEIGVSSKEGEGSTFGFFFTVRRCSDTAEIKEDRESPVNKLCHQIRELDSKILDVKRDTSIADFSEEPPIKQVNEVAVNTKSDSRRDHSLKLAEATIRDNSPSKDRRRSNNDEL